MPTKSRTTKQPDYWKKPAKIKARAVNCQHYRSISKESSIPKEKEYWTLCHKQPDEDGCEIVQLCKMGLITKNQFHGVDRSKELIDENKGFHPDANWYHGEWINVINNKPFNPAMVYLDLTNFTDGKNALDTVSQTMYLCPKNTVLVVNAMLHDSRSSRRFDPTTLIKGLSRTVSSFELQRWVSRIENYIYKPAYTEMITYIFHKVK